MKRAVVLVTALALGSCAFGQKHPGVTIGMASGSLAFLMCGVAVEKLGTCSAVGGVAGVGIGGITGLVTLFADTNAPIEDEQPVIRRRRVVEPPGPYLTPEQLAAPVDAGVPDAPALDAAAPADAPHD